MTKVSTITPCYNMGKYLKGWLWNLSAQTHKDLEIVLDHNDPSEEEIKWVENYNDKHDNILHIKVEGVDPIGISMNRCIEYATGDYLCIWNVDDLRTPDSIEVMAKTLDDNPDVNFVYGNYHIVPNFGSTNGQYVDETGKEEYLKVGMILGPFFMFRKSALKKSGLFDEQLMSGADYDLALRLAFNGKGLHISTNLGYYLNDGQGLSTGSKKQPIERTVIELRYGVRVLEPHLVPETREYDVENIIIDNKKIPAKTFK